MKKKEIDLLTDYIFSYGELNVIIRKGGLSTGYGIELLCTVTTPNSKKTLLLDLPSLSTMDLGVGVPMSKEEAKAVIEYLRELLPIIVETANEDLK